MSIEHYRRKKPHKLEFATLKDILIYHNQKAHTLLESQFSNKHINQRKRELKNYVECQVPNIAYSEMQTALFNEYKEDLKDLWLMDDKEYGQI